MTEHAYTLHTDLFEVSTPGPHFINPRCFGEDFAHWLGERLEARGYAPSEPIQEDWGWVLPVQYEGRQFTISIGVMDHSIGCSPAEWRIGVSYEKVLNGIRAWFQPVPMTEHSRLADVLEDILRSDPRLRDVRPE